MHIDNNDARVYAFGPVVLRPGANPNVDDAAWKKATQTKEGKYTSAVQALLDARALEVKSSGPVDFAKLGAEDAVKLVGDTLDKATLEGWLKGEKRAEVKAALEKQLAALKAPKKE
ncbi:hypothetical protein D7Y27_22410 [Corallococcus sp. AB004]|nr:hypothetical protein D7Y27_22410 [Corallococcus sp. AB004]